MLNITGSRVVDDPTYRYKMPRMVAVTEGRGNGIKTLIRNMADISTSINRPPDLVTKYFGVELGAQSRWDADTEKSTVNGAHNTPDLQKLLNTFIDKFVLCPNCHLPETALVVRKGMINHK
jgi:translation initiation factor 5